MQHDSVADLDWAGSAKVYLHEWCSAELVQRGLTAVDYSAVIVIPAIAVDVERHGKSEWPRALALGIAKTAF